MAGAQILFYEFTEVGARLGDHGVLQIRVELGIELLVWVVRRDGAQLQPLAEEVVDEALSFRVLEQALDLFAQHIGIAQVSARGECGEHVIGTGVPEKIRQARCNRGVIQATRRLKVIQEIRRAQRGAIGPAHRRLKGIARPQPVLDLRNVFLSHRLLHRTPKRLRQKVSEQPVRIGVRLLRGHRPEARFRVGLVSADEMLERRAHRRANAFLLRHFKLRDGQLSEEQPVTTWRPHFMQRSFHFQPVIDGAGPGVAHSAALLSPGTIAIQIYGHQGRGVEPKAVLKVQPHIQLMYLRL